MKGFLGQPTTSEELQKMINQAVAAKTELLNFRITSLEADIKCAWSTCRITDAARIKAEQERDELKKIIEENKCQAVS